MTDFPLEQWFDLTRRISRADRHECETQMAWWAWKDARQRPANDHPAFADDPERDLRQAIDSLRVAVKRHNRQFTVP